MVITANTMEDQTKAEVYNTTLLKSLNTNGELKEDISRDSYQAQLKLIKQNLISTIKSDGVRALQMLQILIDNRIHTILKDVLVILKDTSIEENLRSGILSSVKHSMFNMVQELLINKDVEGLVSLYSFWQNDDSQMFINILNGLYSNLGNREHIKAILFDFLIPKIMLNANNIEDPIRMLYIDFALDLARVVPITVLNTDEYSGYATKIIEYVTIIATLRDNGSNYWHKLWMFLIRLLGKKLHHSMKLMNKLLRVVEQSFKSSCIQQRMKSYDCWKELIDNVSLDKNYLSTEKQIKLLLTPLKAKFANQTELIVKRFEHFVYLMEKLQDNAVLVVKEFLEFCFGEMGSNLSAPKPGQGKTVPELWLKIAQALVELMGHSHKDIDNCLKVESIMNLKPALSNNNNISHIHLYIISAVLECSKLLKKVELNQKRDILLRCLWKSLFNIVLDSKSDNQKACIDWISEGLENLLKETDPYYYSIVIIIFKESVSMDKSKVSAFVLNNMERFLNIIFSVPLNKDSYIEVEKFIAIISNLGSNGETQKIIEIFLNSFSSFQTIDTNVNFVANVWIHLAKEVGDYYAKGKSLEFLVWPAANVHKLTEQGSRVAVYEYYERLITKYVEKSPELQVLLFKHFEKSLRTSPLNLKNILDLLTLFNPKYSSKEICNITLDIFSFMLLNPAIANDTDRQIIELYLKKILETNSIFFQEENLIKKLWSCIENLLKHGLYDILVQLEVTLNQLPDSNKSIYLKYISLDFLVDLFVNESDLAITEKVHAIIKHLRTVKTPENKKEKSSMMTMGGRASKIANLVKQIPKSPKKETNSPFKVFGSQLKKTAKSSAMKSPMSTPPRKKKISINLDDESNSKFVLINSEVKFNKDKLTEHQKETLKKKREDIPALYQDLSQSDSQSNSIQQAVNLSLVAGNQESPVFKQPEVPADVRSGQVEEQNELPPLPESNDSSFEEKPSVASPNATNPPKVEKNTFWPNSRKKKGELSRLAMNIVGAEEFVAVGPKRAKREIGPLGAEQETKRKRKAKAAVIEENNKTKETLKGAEVCDRIDNNKLESNMPEALKKNKGGRPRKSKQENGPKETKNSVKRKSKSESADIHSNNDKMKDGENAVGNDATPEEATFADKRRRRKSLSDVQIEEVRKSRRKSLPSSKMNAILEMLKPKSASPSRNAKKIAPELNIELENYTQSELFPFIEAPEIKPISTEEEVKNGRGITTSDEDEDIIESSQESGVTNANLSKLKMSINNKTLVTLEEQTKDESMTQEKSLITDGIEANVSSVEKKARGRRRKSKSVTLSRTSAATTALKDLINELNKKDDETHIKSPVRESPNKNYENEKEEAVNTNLSNERHELEMSTEEMKKKSTQSQDTQTQNTESIGLDTDSEKIEVFLDLPVKPVLTEADKEIARMDTASLSLVELEELRGFNNSTFEYSNKTLVENSTLTDIRSDKHVIQNEDALKETQIETEVILETECIVDEFKDAVDMQETVVNNEPMESENANILDESEQFIEIIEEPIANKSNPTSAGTPASSKSNLPTSPVTGDTPNRNSELLSNTNDISPIREGHTNSGVGSSDEETEQRKFVPVALKFEDEDEHEVQKEKFPERGDDASQKIAVASPEKADEEKSLANVSSINSTVPATSSSPSSSPPKEKIEKGVGGSANERSGTVGWLKQGSPARQRMFNRRKIGLSVSPSVSRIKKLMSNVKPPSQPDQPGEFAESDVLTFKRDVPSPLAVPRSSILKRKHSSEIDEEGLSPCPKRAKRVNFSDPCTTSKKLFIKDDPPLRGADAMFFIDDDINKRFMELGDSVGETINSDELEDIVIDDVGETYEQDPPIYPDLVYCEEHVTVIAENLSSIAVDQLISKNIKTVGDLAKLSETEVAKLSLHKIPMISVFKALLAYHQEVSKDIESNTRGMLIGNEGSVEIVNEPAKADVETEMRQVLGRAMAENAPAEVYMKMFTLISDNLVNRLTTSKLMELSIEFQKKIPIKD